MLLLLTAACSEGVDAVDTSPIVIDASLELSGSGQVIGQAYKRAMELEVARLNAGDTLGGRKIRLNIKDNRTESATALSQVTGFTNDPEVTAIVTGVCVECATAAAKVAEERGVPMITLAPASQMLNASGKADDVTGEKRTNVFKIAPNPVDDANALIAEVVRNGHKSLGLLAPDDAYGSEGVRATRESVGKTSVSLTTTVTFPATATDFSTQARAITSAKPSGVVIWGYPTQAEAVTKALRDAGYQGRLYFDASAAGDLFLGAAAGSTDGGTMVFIPTLAIDDVIATTPAKAARKQWFEDYTSRYGVYQGQASFAADAVRLIADAVNRAGTTERSAIRTRFESTRTDGLSGPIRITPANHSGLMPQALTVLIARNGRWRLLG